MRPGSRTRRRSRALIALCLLAAGPPAAGLLAGCGASHLRAVREAPGPKRAVPQALLREARPIGAGPRFHPPLHKRRVSDCKPALGPRQGVHVELFAANRVVLLPAGMGTMPPRASSGGRITRARCYGAIVTLDPTGLVLVRPGRRRTLSDLFAAWGEPLSRTRLASFRAPSGSRVAVFVNGRRHAGPPGETPLTHHAEIVIEIGPHVPPHHGYAFPPGT